MSKLIPIYEKDFYSEDVIRDPYPEYELMRGLGPVVYLKKLGAYAFTHYESVKYALQNHRIFINSNGVAADDFGSSFLKGNILSSDPPVHSELRKAMAPPLMPKSLKLIETRVEEFAVKIINKLILKQDGFDVMKELAPILPLEIVRDMIGLPEFGKRNMLNWADAAFNILGIQNSRGQDGVRKITEMRQFIEGKITRENIRKGGWIDRLFIMLENDEIKPEHVPIIIRDYTTPSLDTTISAIGHLIWHLSQNPDQWDEVRNDKSKIELAISESIRLSSPIRSFCRTTAVDIEFQSYKIPEGSKVMLLFASANRDDRVFPEPDRFNINRLTNDHLGFGYGIHMCVGKHLAILEMSKLLLAMSNQVKTIRTYNPRIYLNNTIYRFEELSARFVPINENEIDK